MNDKLIDIATLLLAAIIIMMIHELTKSIVFMILNKSKERKINIWKLYQYIDPIGLIFCVVSYAGFSKPYMYRIKEKRTNFILGIVGFLTLLVVFLMSISLFLFLYKSGFTTTSNGSIHLNVSGLPGTLLYYLCVNSLGMFLVNLFPVSTFDMGLLIAGVSPSKYFSIIKNGFLIKMVLIFTLYMQVMMTIIQLVFRLVFTL